MVNKEKIYGPNIDALIETEEKISFNFNTFLDDKLSRSFLCNHVGEEIILEGEFISYGHKGSALFKGCIFKEAWTTIAFDLGHMWWQNVYPIIPNLTIGRYLTVYGRVYLYNNTYGFEVINIL